MTAVLEVRDLVAGYGPKIVLQGVSLVVAKGEQWAIIGPNGAGKSTLIKCMASLVRPASGSIGVQGRDLQTLTARERAHRISYVPQSQGRNIPYTVYDYVLLGRHPHQGFAAAASAEDHRVVQAALKMTDVAEFANRPLNTLSGGEAQRVVLAGAVSQQAGIMLLDEPTSFLDPAHDAQFYQVLRNVQTERGWSVIAVTHDLNSALRRYTHILALRNGQVCFCGSIDDLMTKTPGILQDIYGIEFQPFHAKDTKGSHFATVL